MSTPPTGPGPAPAWPVLDDQLCFALYAASRSVTSCYRPLLEDLGLTYPQYLVLLVLWEHGTTSVGELGSRLQLDSGTLSPLLKRMEGAGLVTRTRRTDDERGVLVSTTAQGQELRAAAAHLPVAMGEAMGFDLEEITVLRRALTRLAQSLRTSS